MPRINIEVTGRRLGEAILNSWCHSNDMRPLETRHEDDVVAFVLDLLDELDDPVLDALLSERIRVRHEEVRESDASSGH